MNRNLAPIDRTSVAFYRTAWKEIERLRARVILLRIAPFATPLVALATAVVAPQDILPIALPCAVVGFVALSAVASSRAVRAASCPSCGGAFFDDWSQSRFERSRLVVATTCSHCGIAMGAPFEPWISMSDRARASFAAFALHAGFWMRSVLEAEGTRRGLPVTIALDPVELRARVEVDPRRVAEGAVTCFEIDADDLDERKLDDAVESLLDAASPTPLGAYR